MVCYIGEVRSRRLSLLSVFLAVVLSAGTATAATRNVIVDTDVGPDDLMAITLLLSRPEVHVEAITIANGLAHVDTGARNVLRLLALAGRPDVPVYVGRATPLRGNAAFPPEWRDITDRLPGVELPAAMRRPERRPASAFLAERLSDRRRPVEVLALGPLTNIAEAFQRRPQAAGGIRSLVIMGGAVHVPGNLHDGWPHENAAAEFNFFVDPVAAHRVLTSGARVILVPLDATNRAPIDARFVDQLRAANTPLGRLIGQVLNLFRSTIEGGRYYAWDPVTAAVMMDRSIESTTEAHLDVETSGAEIGAVRTAPGTPAIRVVTEIDPVAFRRMFMSAVAGQGGH